MIGWVNLVPLLSRVTATIYHALHAGTKNVCLGGACHFIASHAMRRTKERCLPLGRHVGGDGVDGAGLLCLLSMLCGAECGKMGMVGWGWGQT
jgi:hypothetical protein